MKPEHLLKIIFEYTTRITNERNLDTVLTLMADMGRDMIDADRCTVWLIDRVHEELWTRVAHEVGELRIPLNAGLVGHSISTGESVFINDAYTNEQYKEVLSTGALRTDLLTGYTTKALIVIPFRSNDGKIMGCFQAVNKNSNDGAFTKQDLEYLTLAASYSGKCLESALLSHEIEETQKEIIFTMGEIGESRSKETGNHVKRVAEYSSVIARGLGLSFHDSEILRMASPMHDIGKVAIPDDILNNPGKLTEEEYEIMKTHAEIGYNLLRKSSRPILQAAAIVAYQHHEKWDGTGYPRGLQGEQIHIYGRITAIADVFDALGSHRIYKEAWPLEDILKYIESERGKHFDPRVVDVFMDQLPAILQIRSSYSDVNLR
ncbi:HD domain-containing phosphohydrolase [Paenibacillus tuaregi]|uniref:HD domain-containing phosphohydrolase n=1 Tax=Paenibacillus tuaregi TaxID=1816681 RepID=UPI000AA8497E|nr:HD domain-containing phosphohydrolase [Paenibacillus tuaregi]